MTAYQTYSMSLVERKKQQWAKEREELANLGAPFRQYNSNIDSSRTRYGSKQSLVQKDLENQTSARERRSSLPPLYQNQYNSNHEYRNEKPEKTDRGGETSGYGSDSYHTPEDTLPPTSTSQWNGGQHQNGYESSSSCRDDRAKWGDKGVGIGKFWIPKEDKQELSANEPPNWVKRGLPVDGAIVVANSSPSVSPEQRYEENERPCTGSSYSITRTYIRGQNIPIDSVELAERERRRQLALEHQEAIRQQLEEREKQRQEERARKLREEREEELRIKKEQEHERQRKIEEEKAFQEKVEKERKRKEATKQALEIAEKAAKLEKMRLKMMKQSSNSHIEHNIAENIIEVEKVTESACIGGEKSNNNSEEHLNNAVETMRNANVAIEINNDLSSTSTEHKVSSPTKSTTSNATSVTNQLNNERSLTPIMQSPRGHNINFTPRNDQFTYLFQPSLDGIQNYQYAVLIPTTGPQYPIAIPMTIAPPAERNAIESARTENRILTPTRYRSNVSKCDSSTQTDGAFNSARSSSETTDSREKYLREKINNLEICCYEGKTRERRSRSENMSDRPKWGVNRPPTRYMKQSEKDLLYQRRKLRQKRDDANKSYDEKNSSDDSQTATPIRYRRERKEFMDKRHSRARWRAETRVLNNNANMYQREIVPLETDKDQLYLKCCCTCRCQRQKCNRRIDILKIEEDSSRERGEVYHRPDSGGRFKERESSLPDFDTNGRKSDILNKLSSLHNGLLMEQEKWENSPRTPVLSHHRQ